MTFPDPWRDLGEFIREQRSVARLSVRRLSDMAGISNPYLSQIERGLRRPSAEILQQIAKALQLSAETLYVRAGILDPREVGLDLSESILAEPHLSDEQKQTLLRIYLAFRRENGVPVEAAVTEAVANATSAVATAEAVATAAAAVEREPAPDVGAATAGDGAK
jgi:transcriptional regulator with XRE-family HTH domain